MVVQPLSDGERGRVIYQLHTALTRLGFSATVYFEGGQMVGLIAGQKAFMEKWVQNDVCKDPGLGGETDR